MLENAGIRPETGFTGRLNSFFKLKELGTDVKTEVVAGLTTFLAMVYILAINPIILSNAGLDRGAVFTATCISAAVATLIMGLIANFPIMLAPGMSMNGMFVGLITSATLGLTWELGLLAIFISGLMFFVLSKMGIRSKIINSVPQDLKYSITAALGLFISFLGLMNSGIIVSSPAVLVQLGDFTDPSVVITFIGVMAAVALFARGNKLAVFIAVITTIVIGIIYQVVTGTTGLVPMPQGIVSMPPSMAPTFGRLFAFGSLNSGNIFNFIIVVITYFVVDFFDGASTIIAVGEQAGLTDEDGNLPAVGPALLADATGTVIGSVLGTTSVTSFSESGVAAGMGSKSGLSATVVGVLFAAALFFSPLFIIFTRQNTAVAVIAVGIFMCRNLQKVDFSKPEVAAGAFFTLIMTVLSFSPANGMAFGFIFYTVAKVAKGEGKEVSPIMYGLVMVFCAYLFLLK